MNDTAEATLRTLSQLALRELRLVQHDVGPDLTIERAALISRVILALDHPERREWAAWTLVRLVAGLENRKAPACAVPTTSKPVSAGAPSR